MKKLITACTVSLGALMLITSGAFAQDAKVKTEDVGGKKAVVVSENAGMNDYYKARWAFYNADQREVKRFETMGFSESDFKAIANIALRTDWTRNISPAR